MAERILIVDDNEVALGVITEGLRLRMRDTVIESAPTLGHALSKVSGKNYDVVVVNALMINLDGVVLVAALHQLCPEAVVVTIALSAYCPRAEAEVNPSEIEELEELLRLALRRRVQHFIAATKRHFHWAS